MSIIVVPFKCDSTIWCASQINFHFVMVFEGIKEMTFILFVDIFDVIVINYQCELDWLCGISIDQEYAGYYSNNILIIFS